MKKLIGALTLLLLVMGTAYALHINPRFYEITDYMVGHTHSVSDTFGAPQHSGGTDKYGCHNASVPYHCH